tara:strand:- start:10412 stop:11557 length:1146 start_codon:yes stop_codon:yes gene_type:complete
LNYKPIIKFIQDLYKTKDFIPLHAPVLSGNEKAYVSQTIDTNFVSSVGGFVNEFEKNIEEFTGSTRAVATVNGTAALHAALTVAGVKQDDLVITQALSFVATANSILYSGAKPVFVDVSNESMGLCPKALKEYLDEFGLQKDDGTYHTKTKQRIKAILPMHTFGHPVELDELVSIAKKWNLVLIEDAAESLGSFYKGRHTGTIGDYGTLSFNGNKIVTTGGGGAVLCDSQDSGDRLKHITTTAKVPHDYEFFHDDLGFNYRMPNINAALGCAQLEKINSFLMQKRKIAERYKDFFSETDFQFFEEPKYAKSNYWLNAVLCPDMKSREKFLEETNSMGVMTRPIWTLLDKLPMFSNSLKGDLPVSRKFELHIINLPSSPIDI